MPSSLNGLLTTMPLRRASLNMARNAITWAGWRSAQARAS